MTERIERHRRERSTDWTTFEEPLELASLLKDTSNRFDRILVDCLTVWLSNQILSRPELADQAIGYLVQTLHETGTLRIFFW